MKSPDYINEGKVIDNYDPSRKSPRKAIFLLKIEQCAPHKAFGIKL